MDCELTYFTTLPSLEIRPLSNSLREIHCEGISSESSLISSVVFKLGLGKIFPNPVFESSSPVSGESKSSTLTSVIRKNKVKQTKPPQKPSCFKTYFKFLFLFFIYISQKYHLVIFNVSWYLRTKAGHL